MEEPSLEELEKALGYRFRKRELLRQALTHSSRKSDLRCSNERMEFLGDAILGATVSEFLYRHYPEYTEGELTAVKSVVVSRATLARAAREMNIGQYLFVAKGVGVAQSELEEAPSDAGVRSKPVLPPSLLANAFEAVIAAVYLDGGIRAAYNFVMRHMLPHIERISKSHPQQNFKSALQEYAQREIGATPVYKIASETGPDHIKTFEVVTLIKGKPYGAGRGRTKKEAEQMAAERTLALLQREREEPGKIAE